MRLIQTNWLIGISGILLYPYILVVRMEPVIIRHEFIHVMQVRRSQRKYGKIKGVIFWYCSYLWEYAKAGFSYRNNRYEVEAFAHENDEDYIKKQDLYLWCQIKHYFI
jgi:hypothetical protein